MRKTLLDVNVLVALTWRQHAAHRLCLDWFDRNARHGWATCAHTEAGCVRVLSNPGLWPGAPPAHEVAERLAANLDRPDHEYWAEKPAFWDAVRLFGTRLRGHRQVTDAYLLGLVIHQGGQLATMDRGIRSLLPGGSPLLRHILLIE